MRNLLIQSILWLSITTPVVWAETYKWVDEDGVIHFSDQAFPEAEEIEISEVQIFSAPTPVNRPPSTSAALPELEAKPVVEPSGAGYSSFKVTTPNDDDVFHNIGGKLNVSLSLTPGLQPGHRIAVFLDGEIVEGWDPESFSGVVDEVWRGEHVLTAEIRDANDGVVYSTNEPVKFFVLQRTIN